MRGQADRVVVLLSGRARADGLQFFREFSRKRRRADPLWQKPRDESVGVATKKIGVGMGDAESSRAGHGMAAEEKRPLAAG